MEPQLPSPNTGQEQTPASSLERFKAPQNTQELGPASEPERNETHELQPSGPSDPILSAQPITPPPLPQIQSAQPQMTQPAVDHNPLTAADEDLIEKEWVEKAKKVIAETKHDPYLQEKAVSKLQADYLQKRYNKTVKMPGDGA